MKVLITSATGSSKVEALIDKDSGVIEFKDGDISHVLHEKMMGKTITVVKDAPKFNYPDQTPPESSDEQSKPTKQPKKSAK